MLTFYGSDLELSVESVLVRSSSYKACAGRDASGRLWLIVHVDDSPERLTWICAPISERALSAVIDGRCSLADALRHSRTGTAELAVIEHGHTLPDRCLLASELPQSALSRVDWRLPVDGSPGDRLRDEQRAGMRAECALIAV
jgi:hypothetical protein